ncbi:MAG: metallophosphoesterase [Spongiibacteraceae bacterium]
MNLIHLSDTHFGTEDIQVKTALQRCLQSLDTDFLIVSGDITQRARSEQFAAAKIFFASLPARQVLVIPGNHDIPLINLAARLFFPFRTYKKYLATDLQPTYRSDALWVMCLNTVQRSKHVDGNVSSKQLAWVTQQLQAAPNTALKVVVAHHPFAAQLTTDNKNIIGGAVKAIEQWGKAGLDLVLGGHIHFPFTAPLSRYMVGLQGNPWVVQAGTAISTRVRNSIPNSFMRLQFDTGRDGLCIQRWDYDHERDCFSLCTTVKPWG